MEIRLQTFGALAVIAVVLVSGALVTGTSLPGAVTVPGQSNNQPAPVETIDSCTTITEPGDYELGSDIDGAGEDVCLHVQASNVTLDGNGHVIEGSDVEDSIGLFVYGAERSLSEYPDNPLDNVIIRNIRVTNWWYGAQIGHTAGVGTTAVLEDVTARDNNNSGVYLIESSDTDVEDLTVTGNGAGVRMWEVQDASFRNVTATENTGTGLALTQDVYRVELRGVTSTGNGGNGMYLSTDARENTMTDGYFANNDGAGIEFSDSDENVIQDTVIESNDGPGIYGNPANEERLQNVTTSSNGGMELSLGDSYFREGSNPDAEGLDIDGVASVTFTDESVNLEPFNVDDVSPPDAGSFATERGLNVTNIADGVNVTFDDVGDGQVELWRFDGIDWTPVSDSTHDANAGTISGTVTADGLVIPLQTGDSGGDDGTTTTTDDTMTTDDTATTTSTTTAGTTTETTTTDTTTTDTTTDDGDASTFVIFSTRANHDFGYVFVVDGDVEHSNTENVAADDSDRIVDSGDGTMTVIGSTGDESGDAYRVTGDVTVFYTPATLTEYALFLDGEDVTDELPRPNE